MIARVLGFIVVIQISCDGFYVTENNNVQESESWENDGDLNLLIDVFDYDLPSIENNGNKPKDTQSDIQTNPSENDKLAKLPDFLTNKNDLIYSTQAIIAETPQSDNENPYVKNIYSGININMDISKRNSRPTKNGLKKSIMLQGIRENLREILGTKLKGSMPFGDDTRSYGVVDNKHDDPTYHKNKRFVVSLSIPPLKHHRRRVFKGKRIRTYLNYRPARKFRIDPTYFLLGIGKR